MADFKGSPDLAAAVRTAFETYDRFAPKKPAPPKDDLFGGVFSADSPVAAFLSLGKKNGLFKMVCCTPSIPAEIVDINTGNITFAKVDEIWARLSLFWGTESDKTVSPALAVYKRHDTGLYYKGHVWNKKVWDHSNGVAWTEKELFQNIVEWATGYACEDPEKREILLATTEGRELGGVFRSIGYQIRCRLGL